MASKYGSRGARNKQSSANFALPKGSGVDKGDNEYPMQNLAHARNARARVMQHGTPAEQKTVFRRTGAKYPQLKGTPAAKKVLGKGKGKK